MPINPDAVGVTSAPGEASWDSKDALLYALGVGAGAVDPLSADELKFTTENSKGVEQQVLPTFPVVVAVGDASSNPFAKIGEFNWAMLVHAEQSVELHQPIPVSGTVKGQSKVTGIYDKGSGALVVMESEAADAKTGEPMWTTRTSAFIRGEGGWGGDRGPSGGANQPPEGKDPDHTITYETRTDQALLYRLSGDRNPLHSDPEFAKMAGFPKPILHGLCTYGFTGRALLHALCGSDPTKFRSMHGRFSKPVMPGDALTVNIWRTGAGEAVFQTSTQDGTVVIDGGRCTFSS
jgi:acyl dehydratase